MGKKSRQRSFGQADLADELRARFRKAKSFQECVQILLSPMTKYLAMTENELSEEEFSRYKRGAAAAKNTLLNIIEGTGNVGGLDGLDMVALGCFNQVRLFAREADDCFAAGRSLSFEQIVSILALHDMLVSLVSSQLLPEYGQQLRAEGMLQEDEMVEVDPDGVIPCQLELLQCVYDRLYAHRKTGLIDPVAEQKLHKFSLQVFNEAAQTVNAYFDAVDRGKVDEDEVLNKELAKAYIWPAFFACTPMGEKLAAKFGRQEAALGRSLRAAKQPYILI